MSQDDSIGKKLKGAFLDLFFDDAKEEKISEEKQKEVLKLAQAKGGTLTVSEVALGTSLSLDEAERCLKRFSAKGYAIMSVTDSGAIVYEFLGFKSKNVPQKTDPYAKLASQPPPPKPKYKPINPYKPLDENPQNEMEDETNKEVIKETPLQEEEPEEYIKSSEQKTAEKPDWMKNRNQRKW